MIDPLLHRGTIYAGGGKNFFAIDAKTGQILWKNNIGEYVMHSVFLYKKRLYFNTYSQYFYCIDVENGKTLWRFKTRFDDDIIMGRSIYKR
jgi:outer membrane protein assembly factor BamB